MWVFDPIYIITIACVIATYVTLCSYTSSYSLDIRDCVHALLISVGSIWDNNKLGNIVIHSRNSHNMASPGQFRSLTTYADVRLVCNIPLYICSVHISNIILVNQSLQPCKWCMHSHIAMHEEIKLGLHLVDFVGLNWKGMSVCFAY